MRVGLVTLFLIGRWTNLLWETHCRSNISESYNWKEAIKQQVWDRNEKILVLTAKSWTVLPMRTIFSTLANRADQIKRLNRRSLRLIPTFELASIFLAGASHQINFLWTCRVKNWVSWAIFTIHYNSYFGTNETSYPDLKMLNVCTEKFLRIWTWTSHLKKSITQWSPCSSVSPSKIIFISCLVIIRKISE